MNFTPHDYAVALENEREKRDAVQKGQAILFGILLFGGIALLVNMCSPKSKAERAMDDCIETTSRLYGSSVTPESILSHCRAQLG